MYIYILVFSFTDIYIIIIYIYNDNIYKQSNQNVFGDLQHFSIYQFIRYSLENGNKIWQELEVKLCQNKLILIISDNFNRKLCNKTWPGQGVCVCVGGGGSRVCVCVYNE